LVEPQISHDDVMQAVWAAPSQSLLRDVKLFDLYRPKTVGEGDQAASQARSMALRLTLNSEEANLTEEQIEGVVQAVLTTLASQLGARQRA
jgi:phenylalanyl-tRNA synthetase beta chain